MKKARKIRLIIDILWLALLTAFMIWFASHEYFGMMRFGRICMVLYPLLIGGERVAVSLLLNGAAKKKGDSIPFPKIKDCFNY